jgi:phage tail sheath gpL-like
MPAIAKAVAPSVKTPGLYLTLDLLGGASNPSNGPLRILIMSPMNTTGGNATANTEIRQVFGADDVSTMLGAGNPGHLAAKRLFGHNGLALVDVIAPAESAGAAATSTTTFTGPTTSNGTIRLRIHGRVIDVPWLSGESATVFAARAVLAVNAQSSDLFITASSSTGDLIYTAKSKGPWGNDVLVNATILDGAAGAAVSVNPAALAGGTTEPSFATALSNVDTKEYRRILLCLSNADATLATTSSNADRLKVHINSLNTGNAAKLQMGIVGHTGSTTNVKTGAINRNEMAFEYVHGREYEDLPSELAGAEAGDATRFVALRANYNRIGNKLQLHGPKDPVASKLTATELEDLLSNGVTALDLEMGTNEVFVSRPITTHSLSGLNPDYRCLDLSDVDGMYTVATDLRTAVPLEFANVSVTEDLEPNADPLPAGVVELKDIRAFYLSRLEFWADSGVLDRTRLRSEIAAGNFVFGIDPQDATQVNAVLPLKVVKPLAKIGTVMRKVA